MIDESSCGYGYHAWEDHRTYWECSVCHLIERKVVSPRLTDPRRQASETYDRRR